MKKAIGWMLAMIAFGFLMFSQAASIATDRAKEQGVEVTGDMLWIALGQGFVIIAVLVAIGGMVVLAVSLITGDDK